MQVEADVISAINQDRVGPLDESLLDWFWLEQFVRYACWVGSSSAVRTLLPALIKADIIMIRCSIYDFMRASIVQNNLNCLSALISLYKPRSIDESHWHLELHRAYCLAFLCRNGDALKLLHQKGFRPMEHRSVAMFSGRAAERTIEQLNLGHLSRFSFIDGATSIIESKHEELVRDFHNYLKLMPILRGVFKDYDEARRYEKRIVGTIFGERGLTKDDLYAKLRSMLSAFDEEGFGAIRTQIDYTLGSFSPDELREHTKSLVIKEMQVHFYLLIKARFVDFKVPEDKLNEAYEALCSAFRECPGLAVLSLEEAQKSAVTIAMRVSDMMQEAGAKRSGPGTS